MTEKLHDKLAKILRLAVNAGTDGERDAALARAQALAFKYNLDLSTIDLEDKTNEIGEETLDTHDEDWKHSLISGIAYVNFCRVYFYDLGYMKRGRYTHVVVGRPHNVDVCKQMFAYIMPQIERECVREVSRRGQLPRYALLACARYACRQGYYSMPMFTLQEIDDEMKEFITGGTERARLDLIPLLKGDSGLSLLMDLTGLTKSYASEIRPYIKRGDLAPEIVDDLKTWRAGFETAIVARVSQRLRAEYMDLVADAGDDGKALVVRESKALAEYYEKLDLTNSTVSSRRLDHSAMEKGRAAGDNISLKERATLENRKEISQ